MFCSFPKTEKSVDVRKVTSPSVEVSTQGTSSRSQRATRHKKINFLEMLRGDSVGQGEEDASESSDKTLKPKTKPVPEIGKKRKKAEGRKVKVVQYKIETESDSSEETDSVESDYTSSYDTDTTSESEVSLIRKPVLKQRKLSLFAVKKPNVKTKVKMIPYSKQPLRVKISANRSRSVVTSTPVALQHVGKSKSNKLMSPNASPVLGDKKKHTPISAGVHEGNVPLVFGKKTSASVKGHDTTNSLLTGENESHVNSEIFQQKSSTLAIDMTEKDLKVSPTLPDVILETPACQEKAPANNTPENSTARSQNLNSSNECKDMISQEKECKTNLHENLTAGNKISEKPSGKDSDLSDQTDVQSENPISVLKRKEVVRASGEETPLRIIHRDASPQTEPRNRSQLGEVFVDRYHNKKSVCVRCYTCRKLMTVDSFLRHLHDVVSGGLIAVTSAQTVDIEDTDLTDKERKYWETFQRKKELFDNNQIPSPELMSDSLVYSMDSEESIHSLSETGIPSELEKKTSGPRIIRTPVSPTKKGKIVRKSDPKLLTNKGKIVASASESVSKPVVTDSSEGVRSSSRRRKSKQLYPFEEYSFAKFPRLMKNTDNNTTAN